MRSVVKKEDGRQEIMITHSSDHYLPTIKFTTTNVLNSDNVLLSFGYATGDDLKRCGLLVTEHRVSAHSSPPNSIVWLDDLEIDDKNPFSLLKNKNSIGDFMKEVFFTTYEDLVDYMESIRDQIALLLK